MTHQLIINSCRIIKLKYSILGFQPIAHHRNQPPLKLLEANSPPVIAYTASRLFTYTHYALSLLFNILIPRDW